VTALQRAIKPAKARKPASTAGKNAVTWILLKDALAFIADAYQDSDYAKQILFQAFLNRQVRHRARSLQRMWIPQGQWKLDGLNLRLDDQWRRELFFDGFPGKPYPEKLQVNWQSSSATLLTKDVVGPVKFFRIEVAREDVLQLLPAGYELPPQQPVSEPKRQRGGGRSDQYNWDLVFAQVLRLHRDEGWPEIRSYRKFAKKVCDACALAGMTDDKIPSEDRVREKLSVWFDAFNR
jgi:hypothetical protein